MYQQYLTENLIEISHLQTYIFLNQIKIIIKFKNSKQICKLPIKFIYQKYIRINLTSVRHIWIKYKIWLKLSTTSEEVLKSIGSNAISEWKTTFKSGNSMNKFSAINLKIRIFNEITYVDSKFIKKI